MSNWKETNDIAKAIVTENADAIETAHAMIADAENAARARMLASEYTECRNCQAGMENFIIANPDADGETLVLKHQEIWETCPICIEEYTAWSEWADRNAPEPHDELDLHCHNGDDHRWQNGGVK